jgi:hypothetical protein
MLSERPPIIPKMGSHQNKSRIGVLFFEPKKRPSTRQLSPAFHHELTIKKPRSATRFCQNPQQNRPILSAKKNQNTQPPK